jgi:glucan phosphoethanolaminetransferase (alkaline phosphatase superfamily)
MPELFAQAGLPNTVMIYTSDHGQILEPGKLTHCAVENPQPQMGLVPLMVYADLASWRAKFEAGAKLNHGKASHFQIAPALLALMGYSDTDITSAYDETLFAESFRQPAFTSGDIFGLFSTDIMWTPMDPVAAVKTGEKLP